MPKTYLNPPELFPSQQYGFSQIVVSRGGTRRWALSFFNVPSQWRSRCQGHWMMLDKPEELNRLLIAFLNA